MALVCSFWPPSTVRCSLPSVGLMRSRYCWPLGTQSYGRIYAMCSTAGSVSGASLAYRLSALGVLHRRIKGAVFDRVTAFVKRFGSLALSLAALLPPPFPTSAFVISAGATRYRFIAFVLSFGVGRACRFALLAYFASVFGRRSVARARSAHTLLLLAAIGILLVCVGVLSWLAFRKSEPNTPFGL